MKKIQGIAILAVLVVVALVIWLPKGTKKGQSSSNALAPLANKTVELPNLEDKKRTAYKEWGRNPFVWPSEEAEARVQLNLSGVIWDEESPYALINGEVVHAGDEIGGMKVERIEENRVILSDGVSQEVLVIE
ncbi:MAG: hypothetical protein JW869_06810 [Candidatus Omnitrophica bacterium]|nr:hypothetical protein [Candidatus Omnitrophota bacterium]